MKRIEFLLVMLFLSLVSEGQQYTTTKNYVVEKIYLDPTTSVSNARTVSNVTYLDGFGRKLQEIQVFGAPGGTGDLVKAYQYGVQGRTEKDYLPYARNNNQGKFVQDAFSSSNWDVYGPTEAPYAFTLIGYDNSPLNRVVKQTGPGKAWQTGNKSVTTSYGMNSGTEVRRYRVAANGSLLLNETYAAGSLLKETVTDEDGCQVETFKDNDDRIVLVVNVENASNRLETYSVYDDRGLLRYVLSPEASARLGNTINETFLAQFAYRYDYDRFGRMIQKRLPGCDPVYMVYDKRDRLVMSQDGKQRSENSNKWSYSLYDRQNRVVETGEVVLSPGMTHVNLQGAASASDNYLPAGTRTALQYMAYDNYRPTGQVTAHPFAVTAGYATGYHTLVTGLVTSVKTRVLGEGPERWLTATTYYDDRCRVIQTTSDNLHGRLSRVDMKYDFVGNLVQQRESHSISNNQVDVLESVHEYDDRGRLLLSTVKLNGGSSGAVSYAYDAVGRLVKRTLGGVAETLAYNPRGWLTSKESEPFKMKLRYESPEGGLRACWNGNISEWEWQHGTNKALMYGFAYDRMNRLTGTRQKQKNGVLWDTLPGGYLEKEISYDFNGNIKTLQRTAGGSLVDNLVYTYTGNQLTGLTEGVRTSPTGDVYSPGGVATGSYTYDKNGNMINDSRRALNFSYNVLNLLSDVKTVSGGLKARYTYLGDGTKLRVRDGGEVNGFDYLGSLAYGWNGTSLQLESASFGEGIIRVTDSNRGLQEVDYFLTDHLGSVRVIVDGSGGVQERNDYYPFGARHVRGDYPQRDGNRYKYNGKEEQVTGDLKYLDYGWRMYDSGLGRWCAADPLQEQTVSWTPYRYGFNNPVCYRDIAGLWEKTDQGWTTNDYKDISRFLSMIDFEISMFGGVSEAQYYLFIQEEYDGIGGRLSNGSILLSEIGSLKRKNGSWLYSLYDQNVILNEINKFGDQMIESNILPGASLYTYKYYREKSWERMKSKFPIEALTGYACGVVSEKFWGNGKWMNLSNMKSYSTRFYGNQYFSSGQVKTWKSVAKFASGGLKWIGKGLGVYGLVGTVGEYNDHKLSTYGALYVGAGDVLGLTNNSLGSAWSLGTSLGKGVVESNWYFDLMHGGRRW